VLLIVSDKVLDGRTDSLALETVDVGSSDQTRKGRVLRERLESSSTERRSLDVDSGGEEADCISSFRLFGKQSTSLFSEGFGKGCSDTCSIGEGGCGG
jgi:hypothetical protein